MFVGGYRAITFIWEIFWFAITSMFSSAKYYILLKTGSDKIIY